MFVDMKNTYTCTHVFDTPLNSKTYSIMYLRGNKSPYIVIIENFLLLNHCPGPQVIV